MLKQTKGELDKGLNPLITSSESTILALISLLLEHARLLGKDSDGFYVKFSCKIFQNIKYQSIFGKYSVKLIDAVCDLLTGADYDSQFEEIKELNARGLEKVFYRLNLKTDEVIKSEGNYYYGK